ncbi:chemotaxis protein histidine kinase-like protein [Mizugakiibacter sediminis]|uniref:Chemotaxis protein CheA n=2 Tax=Mizugakiibacter sediminis TaxID=1475481 RepID=A0A0K8QQW0_9GAMM|nr:chemotaxis protein CheA [Mizugakiibacter sediminis]GAP66757.1 chemotaxis protein histidine kinase-like protein [Mizugakiibacter sediminis]
MAQAPDTSILADFLVEAGELLASLDDQLVALETDPRDAELLNAVFRAFHTVKGGAGFLAVEPMVALCHRAEDLLNDARAGRLLLDADTIDALLAALDQLRAMMRALAAGTPPAPAPAALLARLTRTPAAAAPRPVPVAAVPPPDPASPPRAASADPVEDEFEALLAAADEAPAAAGDPIGDDEFEALLDELHGKGGAPGAPGAAPAAGDPIGDDEFEALLDELHGKGGAPGVHAPAPGDPIDDSEFEALLDKIYGRGGAPGKPAADAAAPLPSAPKEAAPVAAAPAEPAAPSPMAAAAAPAHGSAPAARVAAAETTVRVDTARLDALVNFIGELVLVRNRIANLAAHGEGGPLERAVGELDRVTNDLQAAVMRTRMQPVGRLFQRFPRIARDLARQLGKQVQLELEGEDTQLDRNLVEALADPLVHLVRNALDHGIEPPDARAAAGKPPAGRVRLAASQEGEHIVITIADDGRGMDPALLRRKAVEKGVLAAERAERMADEECYELIFLPGFSTRSEISDISGRGVGMDVVKTRVAELGGTIAVRSQPGRGSEIKVSVPLTLAILRALMVRVGGRMLALPLANVSEVFELDAARVRSVDGREVVAHRARPLPLNRLDRWLGGAGAAAGARQHVAVVHIGHQRVGCVVHEVVGREEVVIKPLGALLRQVPGIAGATITGDGRIALIVDLVALLRASSMERVA